MQPAPSDIEKLKQGMRATWMAGDFGRIAQHTETEAAAFVERLNLAPGARVLDVACGTGNLAIPAARKGARVTGADIATNLLEQARARAAAENLDATFDEGDAEQLPYADAAFDVVMSMYGAMFAPRPELVAAELARVCRPGGTIAMANWTPGGFVGRSFAISASKLPPPEGVPAPVLWGDEATVRARLGRYAAKLETTRQFAVFDYPFGPRGMVQFFREYFGPTKVAFSRLDEAGQQSFAAELENLWREHNEGGEDRTIIRGEYLEVRAVRA
jgi:ubiquinone/menaquinone biosynthesis C-methylase UbiE